MSQPLWSCRYCSHGYTFYPPMHVLPSIGSVQIHTEQPVHKMIATTIAVIPMSVPMVITMPQSIAMMTVVLKTVATTAMRLIIHNVHISHVAVDMGSRLTDSPRHLATTHIADDLASGISHSRGQHLPLIGNITTDTSTKY